MYYNPRYFERLLKHLIASQIAKIEKLIDSSIGQAAWQASRLNPPMNGDFYFKDYPALSRAVDAILKNLSRAVVEQINVGSAYAWELANLNNDKLIDYIVQSIGRDRIPPSSLLRWQYATRNLEALKVFQKRKSEGLGLSEKVWHYFKDVKKELELALDIGIGDGKSADALSRAVRKYLRNPDALFWRVRDKETGVLRLSRAAAAYHPGQGVYRSAFKNARRLAATETNIAYRTADHERQSRLDFILGIEVHLSENHTCLDSKGVPQPFFDICDILQGPYPKWFKFTGWHPLCRCYTTTILPTRGEFFTYLDAMDENGVSSYRFKNEVTDYPPQFKRWVSDNTDRIQNAQRRGTLPYFLRDNEGWEEFEWKAKTLGTLEHLDESIAKYEDSSPYYGAAEKEYKAEIEEAAKQLLDANDFGMHIENKYLGNVRAEGFKNQFQTGDSNGALPYGGDLSIEQGGIPEYNRRLLFSHEVFMGGAPTDGAHQLKRSEYEKYGLLVSRDMAESLKNGTGWGYGEVQVRFKKEKVTCTFTADDSLCRRYQPSLTSAPRSCSFDEIPKGYLPIQGNLLGVDITSVNDMRRLMHSCYIELQYHGSLTADCVDSLLYSKDITNNAYANLLAEAKEWRKLGARVFYQTSEGIKELL